MRPALWSVAIQAAGSAATLAAALLVAHELGLAAQGEFGLLRSWTDAAVTLAVLGFPQALLHLQYRAGVPIAALRGWVRRYVVALIGGVALLMLAAWIAWPATGRAPLPPLVFVAAAAVPLAAAHLLWRALALREVGIVPYALLTVAPALLILIVLLPICLAGWRGGPAWALLAASAAAALVSGALVRRAAHRRAEAGDAATAWSQRALWSVSVETGGQNVLTALTPAVVLSLAGALGGPLAQVGIVSLGLHVYQLFGVTAAYVAPLVYDRAARADRPLGGRELAALLRANATPRVLFGLVAVVGLGAGLMPSLWPAGAASALLVVAMALAGALSMGVRLLVTLLLARGAFRPLTFNALGRLATASGTTAALMQAWPATVAVPLALLVTEVVLLVWLLRLLPTSRREAQRSTA